MEMLTLLGGDDAKTHGIVYRENFLSPTDCNSLVACFKRCLGLLVRTGPGADPFWDDRFLWISSLPNSEAEARDLMNATRFRVIDELRSFYSEPVLYSDTIQLVKWNEGQSMPPHADNANPDGSPHGMPWRAYASVIYLNDEYEGGDIYFPRLSARIQPDKGLLLGFRGDFSHEHGVEEITQGVRYTMPGWYSRDPEHEDRYVRDA
jgi:Rps23 Pro-64 3,4-dihydroxylase Tpa1-like proline 4-hydroxylase